MTANVNVFREQGGDVLHVADGGCIALDAGAEIGLGASVTLSVAGANVLITGLPTSDPSVAGALWSDSGVLTVSAG